MFTGHHPKAVWPRRTVWINGDGKAYLISPCDRLALLQVGGDKLAVPRQHQSRTVVYQHNGEFECHKAHHDQAPPLG